MRGIGRNLTLATKEQLDFREAVYLVEKEGDPLRSAQLGLVNIGSCLQPSSSLSDVRVSRDGCQVVEDGSHDRDVGSAAQDKKSERITNTTKATFSSKKLT